MLSAIKRRLGRVFGADDRSPAEHAMIAPPMHMAPKSPIIVASASKGFPQTAKRSNVGVMAPRADAPAELNVGNASTEAPPKIGIQRGPAYAEQYASEFIAWVRRSTGRTICLPVDDLLLISKCQFSQPLGIPTPPDRSLLSTIKRMPGIVVRQNVRGQKSDGSKTTVYEIGSLATAANAAAPAPIRRAA